MKTESTIKFIVSVWNLRLSSKRTRSIKTTGFAFPFEGTVNELYELFDLCQKGNPRILIEASKVGKVMP